MKSNNLGIYRCPITIQELEISVLEEIDGGIVSANLSNQNSDYFEIRNGVPDFTWPKELSSIEQETRNEYEEIATIYDSIADFPFKTFNENEEVVRNQMIDKLNINPGDKVLEVGCGSGRGSEIIAERLKGNGLLVLQDLSSSFLNEAIKKLKNSEVNIEFSLASACYLPFPDNFFDAAHHFGGLNVFGDIKRALAELARVVKPGGKILVGDESIAPWLRNTDFGKIVMNANPLYAHEIDMELLPTNAENVKLEWILKGSFYTIEFTVSESLEPVANFDIPIPGKRGGTFNKRYFGVLEGIDPHIKAKLYSEAQLLNLSVVDYLELLLKQNKNVE